MRVDGSRDGVPGRAILSECDVAISVVRMHKPVELETVDAWTLVSCGVEIISEIERMCTHQICICRSRDGTAMQTET